MSTGFVDVIDKADTKVAALLPTYQKIYEVFTPEKENKRVLDAGWGLFWGDISESGNGTTRHFTTDSRLIIIMTSSVILRGDRQSNLLSLYSDVDTVVRGFRDGSRLGSAYLLDIGAYAVTQPRLIEGKEHILLELSFALKIRETI